MRITRPQPDGATKSKGTSNLVLAVTIGLWTTFAVAGCAGGSQPHTQTPSGGSGTSSTTRDASAPSTSPTIDPKSQPAVEAYSRFSNAADNAQRNPVRAGAVYPAQSDFTLHSFDPIRHQYAVYILSLAQQQVAFKGNPPWHRVSVVSVELAATPSPLVVLTDCPTPPTEWKEYVVRTGEEVAAVPAKIPPPYRLTVEIIKYRGHWGVQKITPDTSVTCTA
jgi:hypothetical protein